MNRAWSAVVVGVLCVVAAVPTAAAQPVPANDSQGYVDSTARCTAPDEAVAFGQTSASRIAVCVTPAGGYQYRGVRMRDGAKLIVDAERSGDGFIADNDGVSYLVTAKSLAVSVGPKVIREETMVDYHRPQASPATPSPTKTTPLPPPLPAEVGGES